MRARSNIRIGCSVIGQIVDPAEFLYIIKLCFVMVPVIIFLNNVKKILLVCNSDRVIVLICIRDLPALSSGSDPANSKDHDQESCQYSSA